MKRRRRCTRSTGVSLEIAVLEYLQELADRSERDRSYCINQIVREHAARNGRTLAGDGDDGCPPGGVEG